jgi:hypothetical protein
MGRADDTSAQSRKRTHSVASMHPTSVSDCRGYFGRLGKVLLLSVCLGIFNGDKPGFAEEQTSPGQAEQINFNIPVQPLGSALAAFGVAAGFEIIADARSTRGRMSSLVVGSMPAREALLMLLADTGLSIRNYAPGSVKILLAPRQAEPSFSPEHSPYVSYFAAVQQAILRAVCDSNATKPGVYRLAIKLWVSASGTVTRVKFLDTSGDRERDATLVSALHRADIGEPPPVGFEQPITLVIVPRLSGNGRDCRLADAELRHASD